MGAFGVKALENDIALDFISNLVEVGVEQASRSEDYLALYEVFVKPRVAMLDTRYLNILIREVTIETTEEYLSCWKGDVREKRLQYLKEVIEDCNKLTEELD